MSFLNLLDNVIRVAQKRMQNVLGHKQLVQMVTYQAKKYIFNNVPIKKLMRSLFLKNCD